MFEKEIPSYGLNYLLIYLGTTLMAGLRKAAPNIICFVLEMLNMEFYDLPIWKNMY